MSSDSKKEDPIIEFAVVLHDPDCDGGCMTAAAEALSGPAQVATDAYRTGWDTVFGQPVTVGQA